MERKIIKSGDKTLVVNEYGDLISELRNRTISAEAGFALDIIHQFAFTSGSGGLPMKPGAVVEHAFEVARLAFAHVKENKMDTPFPFKEVFGDDQNG